MDGSEKEKLVIIGKYANPRCFKNVISLPIKYYNNSTALEISFTNFNKTMTKERRKVLLFSDNCLSHKISDNCSNVKLIFVLQTLLPFYNPWIRELSIHLNRNIEQN